AKLTGHRCAVASPVPIPERKVDDALRDGTPLPAALGRPLAAAVHAALDRLADAPPPVAEPEAVAPGSLGRWHDQDEDSPAP
ncbi:MAG TPA: hypothetical protein VKU91_01355, partial [Acidimicrobiales bacterium]|nr:hypothetical protein [Acidimicrobiales bacterium]